MSILTALKFDGSHTMHDHINEINSIAVRFEVARNRSG